MDKIQDLRAKRNALWEETKSFLEEHRGENGLVDAASVEEYERRINDVKALGIEIDRLENQATIDAAMSLPTTQPTLNMPKDNSSVKPFENAEYAKAFWAMVRGHGNTMEVKNALSVGTGSEGGYTVPDEFEHQLIQALEENNIFRGLAHVIRTSSGVRSIPIASDADGVASWTEEGGTITESDPTFSHTTLSAFKLSRLIQVSNELLNDSAFNISSYIAQCFGSSFGKAEEDAFINGTGVSANPATTPSQPTGILTSLTTAAVTTTNATTISFDDIYKLYYSLKSPYRKKAAFLCHDTLMLQFMLLKDENEHYIWKPGLEVGKPDTILGRPIYTSAYMPAITGTANTDKGKKVCLFGDFSYYWIADRTNRTLRRLDELYAVNDRVGFIGTQRVDGKLILPEAMKFMKLGAAS